MNRNTNAVGNAGGDGVPKGNTRAMTHGLYSQPDNLLDYLEREEFENYQWVQAKFESYLEVAPFEDGTARADELLEVCILEYTIWQARYLQVRNGITKKTHIKSADGKFVETKVERSYNQAVKRIDRPIMGRLQDLRIIEG